jgi:hypothetical protein
MEWEYKGGKMAKPRGALILSEFPGEDSKKKKTGSAARRILLFQ